MAPKTNMERARREELWFWIACGISFPALVYFTFSGGAPDIAVLPGVLIIVGTMAGCVFRLTRAYKREIADLTTDEPDVSAEPQGSE